MSTRWRAFFCAAVPMVLACGSDPKAKTKYVDSYLDVVITPDATCNQALPICVYALETHLTHGGAEIAVRCTDVVPALGAPAQVIQELEIVSGTGIAEAVPASGLIGVEFRGYGQDCAAVAVDPDGLLPVFSGYAEAELTADDQELVVPVSCAQPQEPCGSGI